MHTRRTLPRTLCYYRCRRESNLVPASASYIVDPLRGQPTSLTLKTCDFLHTILVFWTGHHDVKFETPRRTAHDVNNRSMRGTQMLV